MPQNVQHIITCASRQNRLLFATVLFLLISFCRVNAQYVTLNGATLSIGSGTVMGADTLESNASGILGNNGTLNLYTLHNGGTAQGNGTYTINNRFTSAGTFTPGSSTVHLSGNTAQWIPSIAFHHLNLSGSGTTKSATGAFSVNGTLTINSNVTLDMISYAMSGSLSSVTNNGTILTQNTSATPLPAGRTWGGLVNYNSSSAQTIVAGNYADLSAAGGNRTLAGSGTIGISGIFTHGAGTYTTTGSTVNFNGSGAQNIPALTYENITASGGNTKSAAGNWQVRGTLNIGANTTLALGNYNLLLKSDSTYTARVGTLPATASITYGTGRVTAERYVKGRRRYRILTSPVTTHANATLTSGEEGYSIWGNWQNQGNNSTPNAGTFITGGNSGDGYDTQTPNASLFTYDSPGRLFSPFTTANGKNTKYTPLKAGVPYYMFVFGDRTNSAITSNPNKTVLSATGTLLTGDQTYTTSSSPIALSNTVGGYTMIGNPFASPIDWGSVSRTNLADTYWGWDPNLATTGGYVTVSTSGSTTLIAPYSGTVGLDQYIQSGQGFFVKTTASSPQLVIRETDKVDNFNAIAFRTTANNLPLLAINLFYDDITGATLMDGAVAAFRSSYSNLVNNEDAEKISRAGEGLALKVQNSLLSINARQLPTDTDTLFVQTTSLSKPQYRLQIFAHQLDTAALEAYLEDTYLQTKRLLSLSDTNTISFSVSSSIPASSKADRFRIVFQKTGTLSGLIQSITAVKENRTVQVDWEVSTETGVVKYTVEKADEHSGFSSLAVQNAAGSALPRQYRQTDYTPATGVNHYRIQLQMNDGAVAYSRVVSVNLEDKPGEMKVYPNPVQHYEIRMQLVNMPRGKYTSRLFDTRGQLVDIRPLDYDGSAASQLLRIGSVLKPGVYYLQLSDGNRQWRQTIFVE